jgi:Ca2+-binding RTX toxin-like protein
MRAAAVSLLVLAVLALAAVAGARTITGTTGNDRLVGTPRTDAIRGIGGRDTLLGRAGADYLNGGPGRDAMEAGPGADLVLAAYDGSRDVVRCGGGADIVNADLIDAVAADCELVGRRLSQDPYRNDGAQHESEVEPDSFTFGRTTVSTFQVGRRLEGAATNVGFAVTTDDGRTWRSGFLPGLTTASVPPGPNARASDPVVAFDARHATWLISTLALGNGVTRLAINRSSDGLTWSTALHAAEESGGGGQEGGIAFDKNWIACDNSATSPFFGRCYLVYTHSADADMLAVRWSDDGGATWSLGANIGARPAVGVFPAIRPNGDLVVVYLHEAGRFGIAASRSTDGGATWAAPVRIADVDNRCAIQGFRAFPLPSADVDATGRVWATWHDCESLAVRSNAVFVATSADGAAWSAPTAVTRGRDDVLPAIGTDAATGRIALAFMRSGPNGIDTYVVESTGSATRWGAARRLSVESSAFPFMPRTTSGRMLGDYISVHYASGRPLVVWVLALVPIDGTLRQAIYATRG